MVSGFGLALVKSFVELAGGGFELTVDGDLFKVRMTFGNTTNFPQFCHKNVTL